ncbi:unnamed protein product [Pedinophyceae sp. YPF-701]|nr:unnamed protein product [Pedinophyceae sp. YPF-701]
MDEGAQGTAHVEGAQQAGDDAPGLVQRSGGDDRLQVDTRLEKELRENGFRSTRRTKMICTIGPVSESEEILEKMAEKGMNVARLNMCHNTREWHAEVIRRIRAINARRGFNIGIMMDTEGAEIHCKETPGTVGTKHRVQEGQDFVFTIRRLASAVPDCLEVNYDGFVDDVQVGDDIFVDGGMVSFTVVEKAGPDVLCRCVDPGLVLSRANLTFRRNGSIIRAKNSQLPVITSKDWQDIDFAIAQGVDWIAVSFVKQADVIKNLQSYVAARATKAVEVVAKIESIDALDNLPDIIAASDVIMVARGDLGAQIPVEDVPAVQKRIVTLSRQAGKPVIVASHLLQSMIEYPCPTRAEVSDIADVVRQRADAVMLSAETATDGAHVEAAVEVLRDTCTRAEEWLRESNFAALDLPALGATYEGRLADELSASAVRIANHLNAKAIFVFTRRGYMGQFLSRHRPDCPIFAFTDKGDTARRLNLRWGTVPFRLDFDPEPEENVNRTFRLLVKRGLVQANDVVVVVSDLLSPGTLVQGSVRSIQVRRVACPDTGPVPDLDGDHAEPLETKPVKRRLESERDSERMARLRAFQERLLAAEARSDSSESDKE